LKMVEFTLSSPQHGLHQSSHVEILREINPTKVDHCPHFPNIEQASLVSWGRSSLGLAGGDAVGFVELEGGGSGFFWCAEEDRSSSNFQCITSVWNSNWGAAAARFQEQLEEKEEEERGNRVEEECEGGKKPRFIGMIDQCPEGGYLPRPKGQQQRAELWGYDGSKIFIYHLPSSADQSPILVDTIPTIKTDFSLTSLLQVAPNQVWAGTSGEGKVLGWSIDTRTPLPHFPLDASEAMFLVWQLLHII
jgi:hypothetical protein